MVKHLTNVIKSEKEHAFYFCASSRANSGVRVKRKYTCFTQFEASRDNCIGLVRFCSILLDYICSIGSKIELNDQLSRLCLLVFSPVNRY